MRTLPPDANDFARMIERYNREMQQYLTVAQESSADASEPPQRNRQNAIQTTDASVSQNQDQKDTSEMASDDTPTEKTATDKQAEDKKSTVPTAAQADQIDADDMPPLPMPPYSSEIPYPSTDDVAPLTRTREDSPPPSKPAEPYPRNAVGFLLVQVFSARGVFPVEGAAVTVSGSEDDKPILYHSVFTDRSGLTPLMALPAVSAQLSMKPGAYQPYTTYTVRVRKDGFYPVENTFVPIYEGIVARQPVNLVPLPESQREGEPQIFPENGPADL